MFDSEYCNTELIDQKYMVSISDDVQSGQLYITDKGGPHAQDSNMKLSHFYVQSSKADMEFRSQAYP